MVHPGRFIPFFPRLVVVFFSVFSLCLLGHPPTRRTVQADAPVSKLNSPPVEAAESTLRSLFPVSSQQRVVRPEGLYADDGFTPNPNGMITCVAVQVNGQILVGGAFSSISGQARTGLAQLNPNATLDTAFNPTVSGGQVNVLLAQPDGKILVGGTFTSLNGQTRNRIARLNADGTLDTAFNPNANNTVLTLALQSDGKILAGGDLTAIAGQTRNRIARLNADGTLDTAFNPNANSTVQALAVQPDGRILLGGAFTNLGGQTRNRMGRVNADGTLDTLFDPNASDIVTALVVQPDGKIVVGGNFLTISGQSRRFLARYNSDGSFDNPFNLNVNGSVSSLALQADGKIVVGGFFTAFGGIGRVGLARLNPDGTIQLSFSCSVSNGGWVNAVAVQADGKILAGGNFTSLAAAPAQFLGRAYATGDGDGPFNPNPNGGVSALAIQPDGKILVGGDFTMIGGLARNRIARLNPDGTADATFNPNANDTVLSLAVQPDGKIVAGGRFTTMGGQARGRMARLNPDGTLDSLDPNANGVVGTIAIQSDGKILMGGNFTQIFGGVPHTFLARLNSDGTRDGSFVPQPNGFVTTLAIQTDGRILVGGAFTTISTVTRVRVARLNPDGVADAGFNPNANAEVRALAIQTDGKIVIGGDFTQLNGQARNQIGRLNADGTTDGGFNPIANGSVFSVALQTDGKILIGGAFTVMSGQTRNRFIRLASDANLDATFIPDANNTINSVAMQPDGKIVVVGQFTTLNGQPRSGLARLANDTAAQQNLSANVTGTTLTWMRSGASPEVDRVTFEQSADGVNFSPLGNGTRISGGWQLTGVSLGFFQNLFIRARGFYNCSGANGTGCVAESVRQFYQALPVLSITRNGIPQACNSATVSWTVTFAGAVSGVTTSNFTLANSGLTGPALTGISGSGTTRTVTATTGTSSGSLGLNMANATGITPGVSFLPFTGEAYTVLAPPTATTGGAAQICSGGAVFGLGGNTPGPNENGSWSIVTPGITGTFSVANDPNAVFRHTGGSASPFTLRWTVTNTIAGCTNPADFQVTLVSSATITPGGPTTFCQGGNVQLTASIPGALYLWNTGATTRTITAAASGTYSCQVTAGGCQFLTPPVTVTVTPAPTVTAAHNAPVLQNGPLELYATPGIPGSYTYNWNGPGGFTSTQQNPIRLGATLAMSGTYTVNLTNLVTGCSGTASTTVAVQANGTVSVGLTGVTYTGSTPPVNPVDTGYGTFTIQTLMTNTSGQTLQAPMYWVVRQLNKIPDVPNDPRPYYLDSRDAGTPAAVNARQTVSGTLNPGQNVPVQFRVAVDQTNRASFQFYIDFYAATNASPIEKPLGSFVYNLGSLGNQNPGFGFRVSGFNEENTQSSALSPQSSFFGGSGSQAGVRATVDPKEPRRMAVVANDYATGNVLVKYTEDGVGWRQLALSRTVNGKTYQTAFEPSAAYDQNGNLMVVYVVADFTTNANALVLSQKLNDRLTFSPPVAMESHGAAEFVALGRPVLAVAGGRPYVAWEEQTLAGTTHSIQLYDLAARRLVEIAAGKVSHPTLTLTSTGNLAVGWNDSGQSKLMCRFGDDSASFGQPVVVTATQIGYGRKINALADTVATPNLTLVFDPTRKNTLYATFADVNGSNLEVYFTRSTDNGQSWSTPQPMGGGAAGDRFLPCLSADWSGFLALGFYDTRHDASGETAHVDTARSTDGGITFTFLQTTDIPSNTSAANPWRTWAANYGEQMSVLSRGKEGVLVFWTDTRSGSEDIFFAATR
ncbi:MAG: hypothetical protein K1Y36_14020 [Blastocatellia bacterium]|nr:hypothetical protein [Blastocatellia bacterium]